MEQQLVQRSLREPGTAVFPPATTEGGVKTKAIQWVKRAPTQHHDGIAQRDERTEAEIIHHATVRADGTYYRLFALDGMLYRVDDMVLVGCADDEDPALCRITSLWEDHQGHKMVELQQGDDDEERDEVEIDLISLGKPATKASGGKKKAAPGKPATKASGGKKKAAPPPVEKKAAGPTTAASKRSSTSPFGSPFGPFVPDDEVGGQPLPEISSIRPPKLSRTRSKEGPTIWSVSHYEGASLGCDWTINEWTSDGPGDTGRDDTKSLVNCGNGKRVRNYSSWKLTRREFMADVQLSRVESERKQYQRQIEAKDSADAAAKAETDAIIEAGLREALGEKPAKPKNKAGASRDKGVQAAKLLPKPASHAKATEHLKHDEKILRKADALDRKRSLAASKAGDGPTFKEVDGRWLRVEGFSEELAARSPWIVHPPSGSGKAKGAKAAALSRNFSVTRVGKDSTGSVWVQGDIVPSMKKDELVGGAISVDNMAVCQPVRPMAMGVKPAK